MKRFVFEFYPTKLDRWVKQREIQIKQDQERKKKKVIFHLEQLLEQYRRLPPSDERAFWQWIQGLTLRERVLLPDLFVVLHNSGMHLSERNRLAEAILLSTKESRRFFRRILFALYQTEDLEHLWHPLRNAYALHTKKLEKNMRDDQKQLWVNFLLSKNPVRHLAERAYFHSDGLDAGLRPYHLERNKPFFMTVFLEVLKLAEERFDVQFFRMHMELFQEIFNKRLERERQRMVEALIRSCRRLEQVRELALWIYQQIGTYTTNPMHWTYVGEKEKVRFAQWILREQLEDFFVGVNKSHERFQYWKKFIPNMVNVVVFDNHHSLLMYFHDVVIMEVIGIGAVYVYDVQTFRQYFQPKVDRYLKEKRLYELKREHLRDRSKVYKKGWAEGWLRHQGNWQQDFDFWLRTQLGWEVNPRVLEEKVIKEDTD